MSYLFEYGGEISCMVMVLVVLTFLYSVGTKRKYKYNKPRAEVIYQNRIRVYGEVADLQKRFNFAHRGWTRVGDHEWVVELDQPIAHYVVDAINSANDL